MILLIIPLIVVLFVGYLVLAGKVRFDFPSFFRKTIALDRGLFGVYCFTGKQGTGKTYSLTKFVLKRAKYYNVYSNLTIKGIEYTKITSVKQLLDLSKEQNCLIIFDEIFTVLGDKTIPRELRADVLNFLAQQRKVHNIMITTAQEWLELPITFRRFVRIQVACRTIALGFFGGILIEEYTDATQMKWSQLENEYVSPRINMKISKYEKRVMLSYDTYERITS